MLNRNDVINEIQVAVKELNKEGIDCSFDENSLIIEQNKQNIKN